MASNVRSEQLALDFCKIAYDDLELYESKDRGSYGFVYRALWKSKNHQVAVKKVLDLSKEAEILNRISHQNIVCFYGAAISEHAFFLVMEYAESGSLYSILDNHRSDMLPFDHIVLWASQIARGMNYLHNEAPVKIIHRDLKSKNVVITKDQVCKICDFGISRFAGSNTMKTVAAGTYAWMAPEVIKSCRVSDACDVWSFGVVLWELLTHEAPFRGIKEDHIHQMVVNGTRLIIPSSCPEAFRTLMERCWAVNTKQRPSFHKILPHVEWMQNNKELSSLTQSYLKDRNKWLKEIEVWLEERVQSLVCRKEELHMHEPMEVDTGESDKKHEGGELPQKSKDPSACALLQGAADASLQAKIEAQRNKLEEIVESRFGLLTMLRSSRVLNRTEHEEIEAKPTTRSKNERLLEIICEKGKYQEFIDALRESGQAHVVNWIKGNGVYEDEFLLDWPLLEREVDILECNYHELSELLEVTEEFIKKLLSMRVINKKQKNFFSSQMNISKASEDFLDMLSQSSLKNYFLVAECLRTLNAENIADILEDFKALLSIHAALDGDNIDEKEERIVNEMKKWCQENTLLLDDIDEDQFLARLRPMIIAVKRGKSVVLFVSCCTIEEFKQLFTMVDNDEMRKILEKLFNLLLQNLQTKVRLVKFYNRQNAEKLFERELIRNKKYDKHFQQLRSALKYGLLEFTTGESAEESEEEELPQDPSTYASVEDIELTKMTAEESIEEMEEELQKMLEQHSTSTSAEGESIHQRALELLEDLEFIFHVSKIEERGMKLGLLATAQQMIEFSMRANSEFFIEHIKTHETISKLASFQMQTDYKELSGMSGHYERVSSLLQRYKGVSMGASEIMSDIDEKLIRLILAFPSSKIYWKFIQCLRETDQGVLADVAEKGGVTLKMKIAYEPTENIAGIENEIVTKLNQLRESASPRSEDLRRFLSQLKIGDMQILSARYDKGIVAWIWCRSSNAIAKLEKLSKDKKLGNLFSALFRCLQIPTVPKINDVLWKKPDVVVGSLNLCKWEVKTSETMTAGLKISGIAMMNDKIFAVFQNRSALLMFFFDEDGERVKNMKEPLKQIHTPMHMAASLNLRCLFISDSTSNKIYKVNVDAVGKVDEPILFVDGSPAEQINSLSVGKSDNNLVVLIKGKPNRLENYSKDAKSVDVLKLPDQIRYPNNAVEASNGDFVISYRSDLTTGGICRITSSGDWVSKLDLPFKSPPILGLSDEEETALSSLSEEIQHLKHLDHFTLDDEDQVYACDMDADQCVVFLDSYLNMEEIFEVEDMRNPYRIHYLKDKKELLLVHGDNQDSISVLRSKSRMEKTHEIVLMS